LPQDCVGWEQVPDPLHVPTSVAVPEAHDVVPHAVLVAAAMQAEGLVPLQKEPHVVPAFVHAVRATEGARAAALGWTAPVTVEQVPTEPVTSQA
jgi:hypothetical protein